MVKKTGFAIFIIWLLLLSCSPLQDNNSIRWITQEELAASLENKPPMNVGFDVDDTVLFSSAGFYFGYHKYPSDSIKLMQNKKFWEEMNNGLDKFSIPKDCARELIELHKKRGDSIYFITARPATETETVTELLAKTFGLENPNKVIFTGFAKGENFKIEPIRNLNIQIFYGDADSDIEAAQAVGIRGIRIMRAGNSTNRPIPQNGSLGEEVLVDSQF